MNTAPRRAPALRKSPTGMRGQGWYQSPIGVSTPDPVRWCSCDGGARSLAWMMASVILPPAFGVSIVGERLDSLQDLLCPKAAQRFDIVPRNFEQFVRIAGHLRDARLAEQMQHWIGRAIGEILQRFAVGAREVRSEER